MSAAGDSSWDQTTDSDSDLRLADEISLLQAMYPDQILWNAITRELQFKPDRSEEQSLPASTNPNRAELMIRLPDLYPEAQAGLPTVIRAADQSKQDLSRNVVTRWQQLKLNAGVELLDQIMVDFQDLIAETEVTTPGHVLEDDVEARNTESLTVVIWLHHLLATGKRKLALNPSTISRGSTSSDTISGLTKPGYPGIMVFSGPRDLVKAHVEELKSQRWQAFQIRLEQTAEEKGRWQFGHGIGIKEVESMSEVTSGIVDKDHQQEFLKAVGVK